MTPGISIVICCHNSAARLPETLRQLVLQQVDQGVEWEVLVVDNASTDGTGDLVEKNCPEPLRPRFRVVHEAIPGLSSARMRGVKEARHEIVSFIDDDNWVCSGWVARVSEIFARDERIGVAGGPSEAVFESDRPDWFPAIQGFYAVGAQHAASGDITEASGTLLWGAGLCIRKEAWQELFGRGFQFLLSDRKGEQLSTGGDTEICFALRALGWRFWYDEQLRLRHCIPSSRLQWSYARKLMRGMGEASVLFNLYLIALCRYPFNQQPQFKSGWFFQFFKAVFQFCRFFIFHLMPGCRRKGSMVSAFALEVLKGQLAALWDLRSRYDALLRSIRNAPWNCVKLPKSGE